MRYVKKMDYICERFLRRWEVIFFAKKFKVLLIK